MAALAALQCKWIESGDKNADDLDYTVLAHMSALMDAAFGTGFSQGYQENTLVSSTHNPLVYMSMLGRRCMICRELLPAPCKKRVEKTANPLFCFAHPRCQGQFTINIRPKLVQDDDEEGERPATLMDKCDIEHCGSNGPSRQVETLARWHPGFPVTLEELKAKLTPYTRHVNARNGGILAVWVGDPTVDMKAWVKPEDTLLGMLGITNKDITTAKEKATARARCAQRERVERMARRRELNEKRRRDREGELRLALGRPNSAIKWRTVEELATLHPSALDTVGCFDYFSGGMEITLDKLLHRIRFLQYLLQGITQPLSNSTAGYLFMTPALFNWACPQNTAAPYSPALLRFLDALDHLAPNDNCYDIERVRRPSAPFARGGPPAWRLHSKISWSHGRIERPLSYNLRESEIRLAEAKLRCAGLTVKFFPKGDELTGKNMVEYVRDIIDCSFKTREHRLIGYDLMGLTSGTGQEIASCLDMEGHLYDNPVEPVGMVWHHDAGNGVDEGGAGDEEGVWPGGDNW